MNRSENGMRIFQNDEWFGVGQGVITTTVKNSRGDDAEVPPPRGLVVWFGCTLNAGKKANDSRQSIQRAFLNTLPVNFEQKITFSNASKGVKITWKLLGILQNGYLTWLEVETRL